MKHISITIRKNFRLSQMTTFRIGGQAKYFVEVKSVEQLCVALDFAQKEKIPVLVIGGGSNMLVSDKGFNGLVIVIRLRGFRVEKSDAKNVWVRVASGEVWDKTVATFVKRNLWGAENLSLVPGSTGAAAVQNIECYGQEAKNIIASVQVLDRKTDKIIDLSNDECKFRYRKSIFNDEKRGCYIILSTLFKLQKKGTPKVTYPDVIKYFEERKNKKPSLQDMRRAIIYIRRHKLPDPRHVGNSGSFFKNIYLTEAGYKKLYKNASKHFNKEQMEKLVELKTRFISDAGIKIPTAFLIDASGLRGATFGGASVHERQVLVLINATGSAKAHDVMMLVKKIRQTVYRKTGQVIVPEPELVGFTKQELRKYFALK